MQLTATKALVRNYFYREFLPSHLSAAEIQHGEFLTLLGDSDLELDLLDELQVPGKHVHSVELDSKIFQRQLRRNREREEPVNLYMKSLEKLIGEYLHSNKKLLVLNLDICGSYLTGIDPVMTQVLRFARRNPRTVVASYTNVGRDRPQLLEGLKSLALCRWYVPTMTAKVMSELFSRYRGAGLSVEVSINMVLRHFFWLRSHLEHVLLGTVATGSVRGTQAAEILAEWEQCWQQVYASLDSPVRYYDLLEVVDGLARPSVSPPVFDLQIERVSIATYSASSTFYHTGWFTLYQPIAPVSAASWLEDALRSLVAEPLRFASTGDERLSCVRSDDVEPLADVVVWRGELAHSERVLAIPETSPMFKALDKELVGTATAPRRPQRPIAALDPRPLIREYAQQGMNTDEIMALLPEGYDVSRRSVTAHIANARRSNGR